MTHFWILAHPPLGYISRAHSRDSFIYSQALQTTNKSTRSFTGKKSASDTPRSSSWLYKAQARESPGILHLDRVAPLHHLHQRPQSWLNIQAPPQAHRVSWGCPVAPDPFFQGGSLFPAPFHFDSSITDSCPTLSQQLPSLILWNTLLLHMGKFVITA